jgi:hypothetical protein
MPSRHITIPVLITVATAVFLVFAFDVHDAAYWATLRQNLAAEILGFSLGAVLAAWVAWGLARERISRIGKPLIQLIAQLRVDGRLSGNAARTAVIVVARVLGDDAGIQQPAGLTPNEHQESCDVCGLSSCVATSNADHQMYCDQCGLPDGYWKGIKVVTLKESSGRKGGSAA